MSNTYNYRGTVREGFHGGRSVKLRETKTMWIAENGERFRKSTGSRIRNTSFDTTRLILSSIEKDQ